MSIAEFMALARSAPLVYVPSGIMIVSLLVMIPDTVLFLG